MKVCIRFMPTVFVFLWLVAIAKSAWAIVIASDSAADPAYAAEPDGAWKGEYPNNDRHQQNPPGNDNGGMGFLPWSFSGGFDEAEGPYGMLNHFIDGVDFPTTAFNNLGAPAFGLGNSPVPCICRTTVAERQFAAPLAVGDVFSAEIDTPAEYNDYSGMEFPFAIIGFKDEGGTETFNIEAGSSVPFGDFNWRYDDANVTNGNFGVDAGGDPIAPTDTSDGSSVSLEVLNDTTGRFTIDGRSLDITFKAGVPKSVFFTLFDNFAEDDAMGNPTGEHAFYFDNLKIERPPFAVPGDYNGNGTVDAADYVVWRDTLNQMGMDLPADGNGNDMIDAGDYTVWRSNFGESGAGGSDATRAVPEPGALALCLLAVLPLFSRRHAFD